MEIKIKKSDNVTTNKKNYIKPFKFYTFFCLLLQLNYYSKYLKINPLTLLSMIYTCSIGGGHMVYSKPDKIIFNTNNLQIKIKSPIIYMADLITHHIPLILFIIREKDRIRKSKFKLFEIISIPLIYRCFQDPCYLYNIKSHYPYVYIILSIICTKITHIILNNQNTLSKLISYSNKNYYYNILSRFLSTR